MPGLFWNHPSCLQPDVSKAIASGRERKPHTESEAPSAKDNVQTTSPSKHTRCSPLQLQRTARVSQPQTLASSHPSPRHRETLVQIRVTYAAHTNLIVQRTHRPSSSGVPLGSRAGRTFVACQVLSRRSHCRVPTPLHDCWTLNLQSIMLNLVNRQTQKSIPVSLMLKIMSASPASKIVRLQKDCNADW